MNSFSECILCVNKFNVLFLTGESLANIVYLYPVVKKSIFLKSIKIRQWKFLEVASAAAIEPWNREAAKV